MLKPYTNHRDAALGLLRSDNRLSLRAARFLGQLVIDPSPLTEAQADWLDKLLDRAGLPPLVGA